MTILLKCSNCNCYYYLGVAICAQSCPNMPRLGMMLLVGLGSMIRLKIVHNDRFLYF